MPGLRPSRHDPESKGLDVTSGRPLSQADWPQVEDKNALLNNSYHQLYHVARYAMTSDLFSLPLSDFQNPALFHMVFRFGMLGATISSGAIRRVLPFSLFKINLSQTG